MNLGKALGCAGAAIFVTAVWGTAAVAQDASGIFESRGSSVEIVDAYAFRGDSAFDGEPVWIVAVSDSHFVDDMLDRYRDRRFVLESYFQSDRTAVVFLELDDDGTLRGLSYTFGPENACAFCPAGRSEEKVEIGDGNIVGFLRWQDEDRVFDARLDVTVSPQNHGEPLPEDGGAPGAAYMAFHRAMRTLDEVSLRMAFSRTVNATWAKAAEVEQGESFLRSWLDDHMAEIERVEGWSRNDRALLLVEGRRGGRRMRAEVLLTREEGSWRVDDEMVRSADD